MDMYDGEGSWHGVVMQSQDNWGQPGHALRSHSWHRFPYDGVGDVEIRCDWVLVRKCSYLEPTTHFIEDFTTTTYRDAITTNVTGWGSGSISLPEKQLTLVSSLGIAGNPSGIAISGDYAYVTVSTGGLYVVDISDITNPHIIGSCSTGGGRDLWVEGDYVYLAASATGFQIIDINDPSTPTVVGEIDTPGGAQDICVEGDFAFIADYYGGVDEFAGLRIINISDPRNPTNVSVYEAPIGGMKAAYGVTVSGDYVYLAYTNADLQVVNITDPTSPTQAGVYAPLDNALGLYVSGNLAFVANRYDFQIINITDPTNPTHVGTSTTLSQALAITVDGNYAYIADFSKGLLVFNITDPSNPTQVAEYTTPGNTDDLCLFGDYVCLAIMNSFSGIQFIQISDPIEPNLKTSFGPSGYCEDVVIEGDYAFIVNGTAGLKILDISNPINPALLGSYDTPGDARGLYIEGDHAYVAAYGSGLQIIDISDPKNPTHVATYVTPNGPSGVAISGDYAYVAFPGGLEVVNISDPTNPSYSSHYNTTSVAHDVYVFGDYVFLAADDLGLVILNITDPLNPEYLGSCSTVGFATDVVVTGDYAFVAASSWGLVVISISDPTNPTFVTNYKTFGDARDVYLSGDSAFVAYGPGGLIIVNIVNPTSLSLTASLATPDQARGIAVSGDYAFIATGSVGLQVIGVRYHRSRQYEPLAVAQSSTIYAAHATAPIVNVTLTSSDFIPLNTSITYYLSSDNGLHWEQVIPTVKHAIINHGLNMKWKAVLAASENLRSPWISSLSIEFDLITNSLPIIDGRPTDFAMFSNEVENVLWTASADYPGNFTVYLDDVVFDEGFWEESVYITLDNPSDGLHNLTCVVADIFGNTDSDDVWVTVLPSAPDTTPPNISSPPDLSFEKGSIGYTIVWTGSDDRSPWWASIWRNQTKIYDQAWRGDDIRITLDGLDVGLHIFNCTLFDEAGNSRSDIVEVSILEAVPDVETPNITPPNPIEYEEGTTSHFLIWICSDDHPYAYRLFINDTESDFRPWHGENINTSVDGLSVGIWIINLTLWDLAGNTESSLTIVTVIPPLPDTTPPTCSKPADLIIAENMMGTIVWEVYDEHPDWFIIHRNGSLVYEQNYWVSGIIQYSFTSLPLGTWEFELTIYDQSGNSVSESTTVRVLHSDAIDTDAPEISHVADRQIIYGTENNFIVIYLFDANPEGYSIIFSSSNERSENQWMIPDVRVNISLDGLEIGQYTVNLTAWDIFKNSASRIFQVTVTGDNIAPTISSPPDILGQEEMTIKITWEVSDDTPDYYTILFSNGTRILIEDWNGDDIVFEIANYTVGEYVFRCVVYDSSGNYAVDDVKVTIAKAKSAPGFDFLQLMTILLLIIFVRKWNQHIRRIGK